MTVRIKRSDRQIEQIARTKYPETELLQQVKGVGTLIALTFVLTVEDKQRFQKSRDVGCYLGLRPKRSNSGDSEPELRITKEGDVYLRKLLVQGAHYILGRKGPDTDLKRWGTRLADGRQADEEAGGGGGGAQAGDSAAQAVGQRRGLRTIAEQPGLPGRGVERKTKFVVLQLIAEFG